MREQALSVPFTISAATSFLALHAFETGRETCVEFLGITDAGERRVRIKFVRCISAKLLGYGRTPVHGSLCEVLESSWVDEAIRAQQRLFPDSSNTAASLRHFVLRGHDSQVEVLADDFAWEFF